MAVESLSARLGGDLGLGAVACKSLAGEIFDGGNRQGIFEGGERLLL
jgi:hypothetical protein